MKKILITLLLVFAITGCSKAPDVPADMSAYPNIGEEHNFLALESDKALDRLTKHKPGIYVITNDVSTTSPAVMEAVNAAMSTFEQKAYYVDTLDEAFDMEKYQAFDDALDPLDQSFGSIPFIVVITKDDLRTLRMEFEGSIIVGRPLSSEERESVQADLESILSKLIES